MNESDPIIKEQLLKAKNPHDKTEEVVLGSLVGLGIIVIVQLLQVATLNKRLTICLYCFAVSIPLLTTEMLCSYAETRYGFIAKFRHQDFTRPVGIYMALFGFMALLFHLSLAAGILFVAVSLIGFFKYAMYSYFLADASSNLPEDTRTRGQ